MRLDLSQPLRDLDGNPISANGRELTVKEIATFCLLTGDGRRVETAADLAKKHHRALLAQQIHLADRPVDVTPDDVEDIRWLVGVLQPSATMLAVYAVLDKPVD